MTEKGKQNPDNLPNNGGDIPLNTTLFVYGSLKRGYWNHEHFCGNALNIEPATVWGRLYHLSFGFPALVISENTILAHGSDAPLADAIIQRGITLTTFDRPPGDWDRVHGELITFADPLRDLPPVDRLEGFRPGGCSYYQRVLVAARTEADIRPVWLYRMEDVTEGRRVVGGNWQGE